MKDGYSPHFAIPVRNHLNIKRPSNWIGRSGPINWPARSTDIPTCDFFLWATSKQRYIYSTPTYSVEHLKYKMRAVI